MNDIISQHSSPDRVSLPGDAVSPDWPGTQAIEPSGWIRRRLGLTGLWRQPDFLKFWAAESISAVGSQVSLLALPLLASISLDAGAREMGILAAAGGFPVLLLSLIAGAWVDRLRRRPIMIAADLARAAVLLVVPIASLAGHLSIHLLWVVAFFSGTLSVFFDVAYVAYLPTLVNRRELLDGNAKLQTTSSIGQVVGPGLAGVLVGLLTAPIAVLLDALSFVISALFLRWIGAPEPTPASASHPNVWREIGDGLRAVWRSPELRAVTGCAATTNLFGFAFLAIYVLYMIRDLGLSATGVGVIFGLGGAGALFGAMAAGALARRFGVGPAMIWSQALFGVFGLTIPLAVLVPSIALPMVAAAEFLQWLALMVFNVNALSLRQTIAPPHLQGRIGATTRFMIAGMQPIGSLLGGWLGSAIGLAPTLVVGVIGMMMGVFWLLASPLRGMHHFPASSEEE